MANVELVRICKTFKKRSGSSAPPFSIKDLDLSIPDGKTTVILGPSGCGKSTLLRLIAGLEPTDSGEVRFNGQNVNHLPPKERKIGMVFQNYALFPNMTARKNMLTYFLFRKKTPELEGVAENKLKQTSELLGVEISYLMDRSPKNLSGGERQRVAIGRCITRDPSLFLLDEPFSSLDAQLREKYRIQLKRLLSLFTVTSVYITHDQQEALILADVIAVMKAGAIEQVGTYQEIYQSPKNLFIADFLNPNTEVPAINQLDGGTFGHPGKIAGVRPHNVIVLTAEERGALPGKVIYADPMPIKQTTILNIRSQGKEIFTSVPIERKFEAGQDVWLKFKEFFLFDGTSGARSD